MRGGRVVVVVAALLALAAPGRAVSQQGESGRMPVWFTLGVGPFRDYDPQNLAGPAPAALALMGHVSVDTGYGMLTGGVTTDILDTQVALGLIQPRSVGTSVMVKAS